MDKDERKSMEGTKELVSHHASEDQTESVIKVSLQKGKERVEKDLQKRLQLKKEFKLFRKTMYLKAVEGIGETEELKSEVVVSDVDENDLTDDERNVSDTEQESFATQQSHPYDSDGLVRHKPIAKPKNSLSTIFYTITRGDYKENKDLVTDEYSKMVSSILGSNFIIRNNIMA